ncbi:peptidylprolyl isomerase [Sphingomonas sp. 28-63-12]|uniref:peptidylprolyl isomerase n=1 Tax=Sphingomonas sp. 28-63-12 TaxID=1970434 RepID=UPI000BDC6CCD|nr:MAG: peptidylprolyl isomerase [Sphingomonas sp. 28-63-12]
MIRFLARIAAPFLALALLTSAAAASPRRKAAPPPPPPAVLGDTVRVALTTDMGVITLDLDHLHAPITTENFIAYVDKKLFDGTSFYRAMRLAWGDQPNGLIQGGTQNQPQHILKPIAHESTTQTGILHKAGTISMARYAPGTATGDFSILLADMPGLDAHPDAAGDNAGYAAFGHVVGGMEVVARIFDAPTSSTLGEGFMKGQMIAAPVRIISARRVAESETAP